MLFANGVYLKEILHELILITVILKDIKPTNVKSVPVVLIQCYHVCVIRELSLHKYFFKDANMQAFL